MTDYIATDDDLPELFFSPDSEITAKVRETNAATRAAAVLAHYPEIRIKRSQQRRQEAALRSERKVSIGKDKKVFVKLGKKCQMWDWLRGLFSADTIERVRAENSDAVMRFLSEMYAKFYRYSPHGVKWITMKQYEWLKHIACQYLKVPNEQV